MNEKSQNNVAERLMITKDHSRRYFGEGLRSSLSATAISRLVIEHTFRVDNGRADTLFSRGDVVSVQ